MNDYAIQPMKNYIIEPKKLIDLRVALDSLIDRIRYQIENNPNSVTKYTHQELDNLIKLEEATRYENLDLMF